MKIQSINSIFFALFLAVSFLAFSCKDHDHGDDPHPHNEATITITSPAEHATVSVTDSVHITGTITAKETLHGYTLFIRRKSDNAELFKKEYHDHSTSITINQKCLLDKNLAKGQDLELEVLATLDHDGNMATKKVNFHGQQ